MRFLRLFAAILFSSSVVYATDYPVIPIIPISRLMPPPTRLHLPVRTTPRRANPNPKKFLEVFLDTP